VDKKFKDVSVQNIFKNTKILPIKKERKKYKKTTVIFTYKCQNP